MVSGEGGGKLRRFHVSQIKLPIKTLIIHVSGYTHRFPVLDKKHWGHDSYEVHTEYLFLPEHKGTPPLYPYVCSLMCRKPRRSPTVLHTEHTSRDTLESNL